jgi:VCBS repeat-containing protein
MKNNTGSYSVRTNTRCPAVVEFIQIALLMAGALILASCQFSPVQQNANTATPAAPTSSLKGQVWMDQCTSPGACPTVTPGSVQNTSSSADETVRGLPNLEVSLGQGPCPALGLALQMTDPNGTFSFPDLQPGFYCVTVLADESMKGQWSAPAAPPAERTASYTIALGPGEHRQDIYFVWRESDPQTPAVPTATPIPASTCTNRFSLVKDVTIEDGQRVDPNTEFKKVWRIRNEGSCGWTIGYEWVFVSGYQLGALNSVHIPAEVAPDVMMDITLDMKAPAVSGTYRSYWMMRSPSGELFGTGPNYNEPVWVEIKVGLEPTPEITHWKGEYFDNRSLDGSPALIRNDKNVDFDWGRGAPADGLPSDNFSARWTRTLEFDAAIYRFSVSSDDGVRLWIDDRLVIDEWSDSGSNRESVDIAMVSGKHLIEVEYYERNGDADISLSWKKVTIDDSAQWVARFWFNRQRDSKWALVKTASEIDYDWGSKSPVLGIPEDDFSASWTRSFEFEPGQYRFSLTADDGVRLYLDDSLLIDEWHDASADKTYTVEQEISGSHKMQVLFYEHKGNARIEFDWEQIGPANQAPSAQSDSYETILDTSLNVLDPGVLQNDNDPDGDTLTAIKVSDPAHGDLVLHDNGAFSYQPEPGFSGADSFTYKASDGALSSTETLVTITIRSVNYLPSAVDDNAQIDEDTTAEIDVLANDRDLVDTPIEIISVGSPASGNAVIAGSSIRYTPAENFAGDDSFTYTIADRDGDSSSAIVRVTISPVNDAPQATADSYNVNEDELLSVPEPGVLANDSDVDSGSLSVALVETVKHGTLDLSANGSFTYTPDENFFGEDSFTYQASDGSKTSNVVTVSLTVAPIEDVPVAVEDSYSILAEPELIVSPPGVLTNDLDPDGDILVAVLDLGPSHGTLDFNSEGNFRYVPASGFSGTDKFTYWVEDGTSRSKSVEVTIEVVSDNPLSP